MKLLIAIPAHNEEESIVPVIEQSLAAQDRIISNSPVTKVEITVVSDGSTDRTVELASRYNGRVRLTVFDENRGYGAAIKKAWSESDAELLGFMDADGTCDPSFFQTLCNILEKEKADIVLGCRLNRESRMPLTRRVGNRIFAALLTLFGSKAIRDAASGMRVVRSSSLSVLMPLPDGLHFTPAMSARAILSGQLKIVEVDMPYHERQGESKLRITKDGLRFLRVIVEEAFLYRPSRPLAILALGTFLITFSSLLTPAIYYLKHRSVLEWMIYRFVVSNLMGTSSCLLFCSSYLSKKIVNLTLATPRNDERIYKIFQVFFSGPFVWIASLLLFVAGGALVLPSFLELVRTGATYEHWSRFIGMSFLVSVGLILVVTKIIDYYLELIASRLAYLKCRDPHSTPRGWLENDR